MFDGGINACLRDLARFGSLFLNGGVSLTGEQVVPPSWIADTFAGGADSRAAFAASPDDNRMPGGMYRNQFWFPYPGNNVLLCLGIHGQMIYVNRAAGLVAAKLSSWPLPQDADQAVLDDRRLRRDRRQLVLTRRVGSCQTAPPASALPSNTRRRFSPHSTSGPWPPARTRRPYAAPSAGRCPNSARIPPQ